MRGSGGELHHVKSGRLRGGCVALAATVACWLLVVLAGSPAARASEFGHCQRAPWIKVATPYTAWVTTRGRPPTPVRPHWHHGIEREHEFLGRYTDAGCTEVDPRHHGAFELYAWGTARTPLCHPAYWRHPKCPDPGRYGAYASYEQGKVFHGTLGSSIQFASSVGTITCSDLPRGVSEHQTVPFRYQWEEEEEPWHEINEEHQAIHGEILSATSASFDFAASRCVGETNSAAGAFAGRCKTTAKGPKIVVPGMMELAPATSGEFNFALVGTTEVRCSNMSALRFAGKIRARAADTLERIQTPFLRQELTAEYSSDGGVSWNGPVALELVAHVELRWLPYELHVGIR